jgi:hypothetical protein
MIALALASVAWFAAWGCSPSERGERVHAAGFVAGANLGADVAHADSQGIVTRRVWAAKEHVPMGSPSPDGRYLTDVDWNTGDLGTWRSGIYRRGNGGM